MEEVRETRKQEKENWPDNRKEYMSPAERVEQAKRLIPILEEEIANGETRATFLDLLASQKRILEKNGEL